MSNPHETAEPAADGATEQPSLQQERDDLYDRLLRTTAEFENYRRRTDRERREQSDFVAAELLREFLPLLDDLERALAAPVEAGTSAASFRHGVELIQRQFLDVLRRRGVERLEVVGQAFDPEWHEAITREAVPGVAEGRVTAEVRGGYRLGTRLLRPAMVKVSA